MCAPWGGCGGGVRAGATPIPRPPAAKEVTPSTSPHTTPLHTPHCSHGGVQLAVLHPRKVVVFSATSVEGNYLQLTKMYEHGLEHTGANMTYGPFGGASGESCNSPPHGLEHTGMK